MREPGDRFRSAFACRPSQTRGRLVEEAASPTRSDFQRDRDRIIHSTAFRRLKHKTQVFVFHEGDHFRTRLTHTIEVAQITRSIARSLGLDEDLAEALALAHDLGHTPFGHTGEDALHACMQGQGGFDHNAQALRIVTRLERRYPAFDGLNLTWETLEGLVKHNGPLLDDGGRPMPRYALDGVPGAILDYNARHDLWLSSHASAEAQVAALADDIAYDAHDIDDGLRAGLFDLSDLREVPFLAGILADIAGQYPALERSRTISELSRRVITCFVEDVIAQSAVQIVEAGVGSADEVRLCGGQLVAFSAAAAAADRAIKDFLFPRMYRHPRVMRIRHDAAEVVNDLFRRFAANPDLMPPEWREGVGSADPARLTRRICDYIAGMTDRYALDAHARLFDATPHLR
ncbi:MAG: deoxyguanosinetriphosphate triphosphohydrolase [Hyphomicrobiales bacterium]|nr:deoxyguanosinetriphosphate triphosphohydrolase [Hyphomicrobiales bacterium]